MGFRYPSLQPRETPELKMVDNQEHADDALNKESGLEKNVTKKVQKSQTQRI